MVFIKPSYISFSNSTALTQNSEKYSKYDKKIINKISAISIKPFNRNDINAVKKNDPTYLSRIGNSIHNSTSRKHLLKMINLIEGDSIHSENLVEKERLIRNLSYIKDAYFEISYCKDSSLVNIRLVVFDRFSWGIRFKSSSLSSTYLSIENKNLYGLGHQAGVTFSYLNEETKKNDFSFYYSVNNIGQNYLNSIIKYEDTSRKKELEVKVYRDFVNSDTKFAGGIEYRQSFRNKKIEYYEPIINDLDLSYNNTNLWLAYSKLLSSENKYNTKRLIIGGLYKRLEFFTRPFVGIDKNVSYHNSDLFLTSISLSNSRYRKCNLIYNFNNIEDMPYGNLLKLSVGYEKGEFKNRKYIAFQASSVNNLSEYSNYIYTRIKLGSYFYDKKFEQGVLNTELKYISKLRKIRQFRLRNFVSINYTLGIRRLPEEFISLAEGYGIKGTKRELFNGKQKLILNTENVLFTPYTLGGFRFAIYNFIDLGFIGSDEKVIFKEKLYYGAGLGIRIYNPNIVFNTFSISFSVYPNAPSDFGKYHYRIYNTDHIYFNDFKTAKPLLIEYK